MKREFVPPRTLVLIPQWPHLTSVERAWFMAHPLENPGTSTMRQPEKKRERRERQVIAYARVKQEKLFGGVEDREVMPAGIVLEVLQPEGWEVKEQERQDRADGRQLVVLRWRGRVIFLFNVDVERVNEQAFREQPNGTGTQVR